MASNSLVGNYGWKSAYNGNRCSPYISLCPEISQISIGLSGKLRFFPWKSLWWSLGHNEWHSCSPSHFLPGGTAVRSSVFKGFLIHVICSKGKFCRANWYQTTVLQKHPLGFRKRNRAAQIATWSVFSKSGSCFCASGLSWQCTSSHCGTFQNRVQSMRCSEQDLDSWTWRTFSHTNKTRTSEIQWHYLGFLL